MKVIYQTSKGAQTDFEFQYIDKVLFAAIEDKTNVFDQSRLIEPFTNEDIVVYSNNHLKIGTELNAYLHQNAGVLLHLSNEGQNHLARYYKAHRALLRTACWNPFTAYNHVFTLPLGFQSGYLNEAPDDLTFEDRKYIWSFVGAIKQDRKAMLDAFKNIEPNWYFQSKDWGTSDQKTTAEIIEIYQQSIFAPTPMGNINFECFRTMESLEWGCIPITIKFLGYDGYKYLYGDHPFIVGVDWEDAATQVKALMNDKNALLKKQKEVHAWYLQFKQNLALDVRHIVNGEFEKVTGKQFEYQKLARKNWQLRWRFFKHFTLDVYRNRLMGNAIKANN